MPPRNRIHVAMVLAATILVGLASRKFPGMFPHVLGKYPGDALWGQMVYWLVCLAAPASSVARVAILSLAISYADEISQLYQAAWIDHIRATTIGHLLLGSRFSWLDMLSYTVGIALVAVAEWTISSNRSVTPAGCRPGDKGDPPER